MNLNSSGKRQIIHEEMGGWADRHSLCNRHSQCCRGVQWRKGVMRCKGVIIFNRIIRESVIWRMFEYS